MRRVPRTRAVVVAFAFIDRVAQNFNHRALRPAATVVFPCRNALQGGWKDPSATIARALIFPSTLHVGMRRVPRTRAVVVAFAFIERVA